MKLTIVGGGGFRVPLVYGALLEKAERLRLDEVVLQVHAVDDPRRGLFSPTQAESWVRAFARRIGRPFRVALPAYDVRVSWSRDGALASVEGEVPLLTGTAPGETLRAAPGAVLAFLHAMQRAAPDNLVGIAKRCIHTEMVRTPEWLPDLPLAVEIGVGQNYGAAK